MKTPIKHFAVTAMTATALSVLLAGPALAAGVPSAQPLMLAASETMDKAEDAVSDTWITSKVKSTFLADSNLSGLDIKVETIDGVVTLTGAVANQAQKDKAVAVAKQIKGVKSVEASGLTLAAK